MNTLITENPKETARAFLAVMIIIAGVAIYQIVNRKYVEKNGVFTKCTIINSEGYKGGIMMVVKYYFEKKEHVVWVKGHLGKSAIGSQYFIKLLPQKPEDLLFFQEYPVPDCLLNVAAPDEGWKTMPACK